MSTLKPEQATFFDQLVDLDIPDSVAVIIALKTNWAEIRRWDEDQELRALASIIWQTGLVENSDDALKMAKKIRDAGLDAVFDPKLNRDDPTVDQLLARGTDDLWLKIRQDLESRDINTLSPDEKNYLILAIFYTTDPNE